MMEEKKISKLWRELSVDRTENSFRSMRSLDAKHSIFISWNKKKECKEILFKMNKDIQEKELPKWKGIDFTNIKDSQDKFITMELLNEEDEDVFLIFCKDAIEYLKEKPFEKRNLVMIDFLQRWDSVFSNKRSRLLSKEKQRGLYAELFWLRKMIHHEISNEPYRLISSWLGPERAYHDFENENGSIIEVKSTITKEPRKVIISNERQLDDTDLNEVYLYILTININKEGRSLPEIIEEIQSVLELNKYASTFKRKLAMAGYLEKHSKEYTLRYNVRMEELFKIREDFPRIIRLDSGLGDLKYSIQISSCKKFEVDIDNTISNVFT